LRGHGCSPYFTVLKDFFTANTLESGLLSIEGNIISVTRHPVLGAPFGVIKSAMGALQLTAAIASSILLIIPRLMGCCKHALTRAIRHIPHGCGNLLAGALESIPGMVTLIYKTRHADAPQQRGIRHPVLCNKTRFIGYLGLPASYADTSKGRWCTI